MRKIIIMKLIKKTAEIIKYIAIAVIGILGTVLAAEK